MVVKGVKNFIVELPRKSYHSDIGVIFMKRKVSLFLITLFSLNLLCSVCSAASNELGCENNTSVSISEADSIMNLLRSTEEELIAMDISEGSISKILSGEAEQEIREEILHRKFLDEDTLKKGYGYTDKQIASIKDLSEKDTTETMLAAVDAVLTIDNQYVFFRYYTQSDQSHFVVKCDWKWSCNPITSLIFTPSDIFGCGWNNDFSFGYDLLRSWNYLYITYRNSSDGSCFNDSYKLVENEINNSYIVFPMKKNGKWAESGSTTISLRCKGIVYNAKFYCKYGANDVETTPSISLPIGISFSFNNVKKTINAESGVITAKRPIEMDAPIIPVS